MHFILLFIQLTVSVGRQENTFTLFHAVASYSVKCGDVATGYVERETARAAPPRGREDPCWLPTLQPGSFVLEQECQT